MRPITIKMLESGIIDFHVARLMERWGNLDVGAADLVGKQQVTKQTLTEFAEELDSLMAEPQFRETRLEIDTKSETRVFVDGAPNKDRSVKVYVDSMGRLVFPISSDLRGLKRGSELLLCAGMEKTLPKEFWLPCTVMDIEPLFQDEKMVALQVSVDREIT